MATVATTTAAARRRDAFWQLVRYAIVGGVTTLLHGAVYLTVVRGFGGHPQIGNLCGYVAAVLSGSVLHSRVSFRAHGTRTRSTQVKFVAASLLSYLINAFWTWLCTTALHLPNWTPLPPIAVATPLIMFIVYRLWVFR